ncbi:MAG: CdaR family protein [Candidatus Promineifilaceae bacterium]
MLRRSNNFLADFLTILLSLVLAIIIWVTAVRENNPFTTRTLELTVQQQGLPDNALVTNTVQEAVRIEISGPSATLTQLRPEDFHAVIEPSQLPFGESAAPIQVQFAAEDVTLLSQFPETAVVILERQTTRDIPVIVSLRGTPARGHTSADPISDPSTIQISGPAGRIEEIAEAHVTILLEDARESLVVTRRPLFYDQQGNVVGTNGLSLSVNEINITIAITQLADFAEKPVVVNWIGEPDPGYRLLNVTNEPRSVLVTGSPEVLSTLGSLQTEPIDITGATETISLQAALILPDGVNLDAVQSILVVIEIEPILTSSVVPIMPEIRALGPGLTATLSVDTVRVILYGPLPVLDSLTPTDVRVTLDLLGLESGTHNITPNVVVTATGLEVRSTQPAFVTVVITDAITTTLPTESMLRDTIRPVSARNVPAFNHWLTFPPVFLSILRNTVYTLYT